MVVRGDMCSVTGESGNNEDCAVVLAPVGACLADGMGGERMGGIIATCACNVAAKTLREGGSAMQALDHAQAYSRELIKNLGCGPGGAALTVARCDAKNLQVAWAGDVICMLLRAKDGTLRVLTTPDRGKRGIVSAVGMDRIRTHSASCRIGAGDRILLCSDGVWESVGNEEICDVLQAASVPREAAVRLVVGRGNGDDATAVVLFVEPDEG